MNKLTAAREGHRQIVTSLMANAADKGVQELVTVLETLEKKMKLLEDLDENILTETAVEQIEQEISDAEQYKLKIKFAIQKYKNIISIQGVNEPKHVMKMLENNSNRFAESKNFIQSIADVSLMMANISQLRAVVGFGDANRFYIHLLILVMLSLASHIMFVFFTVIRSHFLKKHHIALNRASSDIEKHQTKDINNQQTTQQSTSSTTAQSPQGTQSSTDDQSTSAQKTSQTGKSPKADQEEEKQVTFCCCCTKKYRGNEYSSSDLCQCPHCHTDRYLGYICNILVFITICANIGITGIGLS
ncbi:uncharacterized protein LOC127714173 [Mytilus californianus]|uniref:uncharacterized protein LOC127714173 n=1 Tax=Mytilus californianus TaxID=6549 RepID=UPI002245A47D|nr:uncharacterized protein LOC127714173 [Mytilus californianus]